MNEKHQLTVGVLKLCDLGIVVCSFLLATIVVVRAEHTISLERFLSMRTKVSNVGMFLLALAICHVVFQLCGLYQSRRMSKRRSEIFDVLKATTLVTAVYVVFGSIFSVSMITINFLSVFWVLSTVALTTSRLLLRAVAAQLRSKGKDLRYMLVLGTNPRAIEFARRIDASPNRGYRILGFIDDDWPGIADFKSQNLKLVSNFDGLAEYLRQNVVDEVAIYLPFGSFYKHSHEVASLCQEHGINMRFNSDIFGLKKTRWRAEEFEGYEYISTYTDAGELWPRTAKRMLDVVVASTALLVLSPLLLLAALAVKLTSPGPIFFLQERIGRNKRRFKIFKFRTMVPNAEKLMATLEQSNEMSGPVFKMRSDPRITRVGKLLRTSSIDELPQLLNVIKGDMSLVGPRPLPVRDFEGFNEDWQRRRFSVKPGITCLWQVKGRSGITFDQWMLLDLQYLDEWSFWLDLKILLQTVPAVVRGSGAA